MMRIAFYAYRRVVISALLALGLTLLGAGGWFVFAGAVSMAGGAWLFVFDTRKE